MRDISFQFHFSESEDEAVVFQVLGLFVSVPVQVSVGDEPPAEDKLVFRWPPPLHHPTLSSAVGVVSVLVEKLQGEGGSGRPLQPSIVLSRLGPHIGTDTAEVVWVLDMDLVALLVGV